MPVKKSKVAKRSRPAFDAKTSEFRVFPPNVNYPDYLKTPIYVPQFANRKMTPTRIEAAILLSQEEIEAKLRALAEFHGVDEHDADAAIKLAIALANAHVPGMKFTFSHPPKSQKGPAPSEKHRSDAQWHYVKEAKTTEGFKHDIQAIRHLMKIEHALFRKQTEDVIAQRVKEAKGREKKKNAADEAEKLAFSNRMKSLLGDANRAGSRTQKGTK